MDSRGGATGRAFLSIGLALVVMQLALGSAAAQQLKLRSVWEGVYSSGQADRGKMSFQTFCADCHAGALNGFVEKELIGPSFRKNWDAATANDLFQKISVTMPANDRGSLSRKVYVDIIAYILQANGYPAGMDDLTDSAMSHIQIAGKEGPMPLEPGAPVRVSGCMAQGPDKKWQVTQSGGPAKIKGMSALPDSELAEIDQLPPGTQTVGLDGDVSAAPRVGPKLVAKGLLIKTGPEARIRVVTLQVVNEACGH
jgi:quinoprotein glucose dehydrogenase